jgi:replication factor C small subunit
MFNSLLIEKYRPTTIKDFCLAKSDVLRTLISKIQINSEIPNLLLTGSPGIGKTTLAKIITNSLIECDSLYINASDENGIDTIRNKVINYAKTKSLYDLKIIVLDEADGLSSESQKALRNVMEQYSSITRFILTANYKHKVIEALRSRCQTFNITHDVQNVVDRVNYILDAEKIKCADDDLIKIVKDNFPDIRKIISTVQKLTSDIGEIKLIDNTSVSKLITDLYKLISCGYVLKCRKLSIKNEIVFNNDYPALIKELFNHIDAANIDDEKKKAQLMICAEHLYRAAFCMDMEINAYACFIALSKA